MTWLRAADVDLGGGVNAVGHAAKDALKDGTSEPSGVPAPPPVLSWVVVKLAHDADLDELVPHSAVGPYASHDEAVTAALTLRCDEYHVLPLVEPDCDR